MKTKSKFQIFSFILMAIIFLFNSGCNSKKINFSTTVKDIDGNVYHTVKIGTQTWMVENLKTTKYRDGTSIPNITDNDFWVGLTTGAYCNYNNDAEYVAKYGRLYNWYAVQTGILAPAGWHVATDAEWTTLENYMKTNMGNLGSVGNALASKTDWNSSPITEAIGNDLTKNNNSGFTAMPGGCRYINGFLFAGENGEWWSSTETNTSYAWYRDLDTNLSDMSRSNSYKYGGNSVRCVRN